MADIPGTQRNGDASYLEALSNNFDTGVGQLYERMQTALNEIQGDATDAKTLARFQAALGAYTTMRAAQSGAVKSMKDAAQGIVSKF